MLATRWNNNYDYNFFTLKKIWMRLMCSCYFHRENNISLTDKFLILTLKIIWDKLSASIFFDELPYIRHYNYDRIILYIRELGHLPVPS